MTSRHALRRACLGSGWCLAFMLACSHAKSATPIPVEAAGVDVAIVLAVDASSSIDPSTADLQREGHAQALLSKEVISAIRQNRVGCIAIAYVEWSSLGRRRIVVPWSRICDLNDAGAVATAIRERGDYGQASRSRGRTSLSFAIDASSALLDEFQGEAARKVIDISSNGINNDGGPVASSREQAVALGRIINGITISASSEADTPDLEDYFFENVIGGDGAFVMHVDDPSDYFSAIRRKLVMEISLNHESQPAPCRALSGAGSTCLLASFHDY